MVKKLNPPLNYLDHMRNKLELSFLVLHGKQLPIFTEKNCVIQMYEVIFEPCIAIFTCILVF